MIVLWKSIRRSHCHAGQEYSLVESQARGSTRHLSPNNLRPGHSVLAIRTDNHIGRNFLPSSEVNFALLDVDFLHGGFVPYLRASLHGGVVQDIVQVRMLKAKLHDNNSISPSRVGLG